MLASVWWLGLDTWGPAGHSPEKLNGAGTQWAHHLSGKGTGVRCIAKWVLSNGGDLVCVTLLSLPGIVYSRVLEKRL